MKSGFFSLYVINLNLSSYSYTNECVDGGKEMTNTNIYKDIATRTGGDIYIGVVGPVRTGKSTELMHITSGYHYHTVRAENEAVLDRIEAALTERNYIVPEL